MDRARTSGTVYQWSSCLGFTSRGSGYQIMYRTPGELLDDDQKDLCSNSKATIKVLPSTECKLIWVNMQVLENLDKNNKVTLTWVEPHIWIQGNEIA